MAAIGKHLNEPERQRIAAELRKAGATITGVARSCRTERATVRRIKLALDERGELPPAPPRQAPPRLGGSAEDQRVVHLEDEVLDLEAITPEQRVSLQGEGALMAAVTAPRTGRMGDIVATIQAELGANFQITLTNDEMAHDLALLLRSGALAAPMEIVAESTVGPQLGAENIKKGFDSTLYGFAAITIFMIIYYLVFGFFSVLALAVNLLLLVGVLSGIQATLTLPGMAAIALTLGMAIDANVLINERIREELRAGNSPQLSIANGFEHAWATILDSNITTLIVGLALLVFGTGPVQGFAVVHCLGITTSIFSSVFVSRGVVNLWYGRRKKLAGVKIGQIWKPKEG